MNTKRIKNLLCAVLTLSLVLPNFIYAEEKADRAQNPYLDKGDKYELPIVSDIPQGERVEIAKDKAQADLVGWNDEYRISIIPQIPTPSSGERASRRDFRVPANRPPLSKQIRYKVGDVTAFMEPKSENEFDIDFTLHRKPDTNVFTYAVEGAEDFDFFYQPALTQAEIDEGVVRPENVVGSYAVYHKTKANHAVGKTNYTTGKAFHIYRPKIVDAGGREVWGELLISGGTLSVTVPQDFLDTALYPVVVDPTFGNTNIGGTNTTWGLDDWRGRRGAVTANGTVDSVSMYSGGGSGNLKGTVVADSDKTILTNGVGGSVAVGAAAWYTSTFATPPSVSNGSSYFASGVCDVSTPTRVYYDAGGSAGDTGFDQTNSFATPTNPTDGLFTGTAILSIYATYTATVVSTTPSRIMRLFEGFTVKFVSGRIIIHQKQ